MHFTDFICVLRNVEINILALFYDKKHRCHVLQFLTSKPENGALDTEPGVVNAVKLCAIRDVVTFDLRGLAREAC